jgi:hypothetical protein
MALATFGVVAVVALVLLWQWMHQSGPTTSGEPPSQIAVAARTPIVAEPAQPATVVDPIPAPAQEVDQATAVTNAPPIAEAPPKPAPLRLQAIFFNPTRPSAMIGGKTLFIGDKLGQLRVVAIDQESATLAGAGETKVLSLAQ